jgi:hypothetical protein
MVYFFTFIISFFYVAGKLLKQLQLRSYLSSFAVIPLSNLRFLVAVSASLKIKISLNLRKSSSSSFDKEKESSFFSYY